jgi:ankyrin repeat protein
MKLIKLFVALTSFGFLPTVSMDPMPCTPLFMTCKMGDWAALDTLLCTNPDLSQRDEYGCTPLHIVISCACLANDQVTAANALFSAKRLLRAGANINAFDNDGLTPLMTAVIDRNLLVTKFLVDMGADCDARPAGNNANQLSAREIAKALTTVTVGETQEDLSESMDILNIIDPFSPEQTQSAFSIDIQDHKTTFTVGAFKKCAQKSSKKPPTRTKISSKTIEQRDLQGIVDYVKLKNQLNPLLAPPSVA